jgi:hypothetical protein
MVLSKVVGVRLSIDIEIERVVNRRDNLERMTLQLEWSLAVLVVRSLGV